MTRSEQRALEAYPQQNDKFYEVIRDCYMEGYNQAEKDLGWISVKDRLPEEALRVLVKRNNKGLYDAIKRLTADAGCVTR